MLLAETKYLRDYQKPDFAIKSVELEFDLRGGVTHVCATMSCVRQGAAGVPLILNGQDMTLVSVEIDGVAHASEITGDTLVLNDVPDDFTLIIKNDIDPASNTALEGLYVSNAMYCTQCEAEGFRRITYFLDRPDVMATYKVRIEADKSAYPVLLSNGNNVQSGDLDGGRHFTVWDDPFPKPCYLFALVAGDLAHLEDNFTTRSGRDVTLRIHVAPDDLDKCPHAMASLKQSMKWDEDVYGLEYDLDIFNIVAVSHFNMGAMENKSLNIFNTKCVLAHPESATDGDFAAVEAIVAHEYFHNWTGNRVTCRDWFQLSLKEGLTVFRDQEFSADVGSRAVKRIEDVRVLRQHQFAEDSGPMAHPVRPASYIEINNFYTVTVYEKGAEVIRMMHTLMGPENYRKGIDLYFERHDGQAVTCDDFAAAMEDASGVDFTQFRLWYSQAGTPEVTASGTYEDGVYSLTLSQTIPDTPGQTGKKPAHIPFAVGLLGADGSDLPLQLDGENAPTEGTRLLDLTKASQTFHFVGLDEKPVPSLLRGFSAPVKLKTDLGREDLLFLLAHDSDSFNRWEAVQTLATDLIMSLVETGGDIVDPAFIEAIRSVLNDTTLDAAFVGEILALPSEGVLGQQKTPVDVDGIHRARELVRRELASALRDEFLTIYEAFADNGPYEFTQAAVGRRRLKNMALGYLMELGDFVELANNQFYAATNMTDEISALGCLVNQGGEGRDKALAHFYDKWHTDPLVLDKWFSIQAAAKGADVLDVVRALRNHEDFDLKTPNRVRSLVSVFCGLNPKAFHEASGAGYEFLSRMIKQLDPLNPQIAAGLTRPLTRWRVYDTVRQNLMKAALEDILKQDGLSADVYELASKSLKVS